jgi:translation initiation factor IF-2
VSNELFDQQNLGLEMYGGNIPSIEISAKTGLNIDLLQELIIYEAEKL